MQNRLTYSQLKSFCRVQTHSAASRFVGFRVEDNIPEVLFPLGYKMPSGLEQLQADICSLIISIQHAAQSFPEIELGQKTSENQAIASFPFQDYMFLIKDFLQTSLLYSEKLTEYRRSPSGAISWPRTIANIKPDIIYPNHPIYLEYITKTNRTNDDALMTLIHEYCLSLAFKSIGWLFTSRRFPTPRLTRSTEEHLHLVTRRLGTVFNDRKRHLLISMFNILSRDSGNQKANYEFGTERFEYAWEYMIDRAFGEQVEERRKYFPSAEWQLMTGDKRFPAPLEPDTVMTTLGNLYVLDAKYYRYGVTGIAAHLPGTSDIGKQVIYGQYARKITNGLVNSVFNAFLIPGEVSSSETWIELVALATPTWIDEPQTYEHVATLVIDTTYLLRNYDLVSDKQKKELAQLFENRLLDPR